ncbi:MAG: hypothetical protein OXE50_05310 [Chloroflexi bacterium]|nr:hypothetical protein [Chloroflexota bacterium]
MDSLAVAVPVFLASAVLVVFAGVALARYGDQVADITGWGTLWVGTILVSVATSLPELMTNITAVLIDAPGLALGNVFGADMINIFTISMVAIVFGVRNLFSDQPKDTQTLVIVAVVLGIITFVFGVLGDWALGPTSVGAVVIAVGYVVGMKLVYNAGREGRAAAAEEGDADAGEHTGNATRVWVGFSAAAAVVLIAAYFLAISADGIAEATGLGRSFIGVLLVSIVTTLPEASVTVAAAMRRSYGLVLGNIYGSCAFNLFVIPIAGLFFAGGPLLAEMESAHFVAAGAAVGLMCGGFLIIRSFRTAVLAPLRHLTYALPPAYVVALFFVFRLSVD